MKWILVELYQAFILETKIESLVFPRLNNVQNCNKDNKITLLLKIIKLL